MKASNKLKDYLRVVYPGIYVLLGILVASVIGMLIWAFAGTISISEDVTGIVLADDPEGNVRCSVNASSYNGVELLGSRASVRMSDGSVYQGTVVDYSQDPVSAGEFADAIGLSRYTYDYTDWINLHLLDENYVYLLAIKIDADLDAYHFQLANVSITVSQFHPIEFLAY